jgi:hypothetical protein
MASNPVQIYYSGTATNVPALGIGATDSNIALNGPDELLYYFNGTITKSFDLSSGGGGGFTPQTVLDTTNRITSSTTFIDLPTATITVDQGTGTYKVIFTAKTSTGTDMDYIINVNGSDVAATEVEAQDSTSVAIHWVGSMDDGQIVKLRFKKVGGSSGGVNKYMYSAHRLI